MKQTPAFVICNDRGEVFTHWASACSISPSGCEDYYSVPEFGRQQLYEHKPGDFNPHDFDLSFMHGHRVNDPHVFASRRAAEKAMRRIYGRGQLAIVEVP